ncbi:hypothetical protein [uncultured Thiodictyon sp.]|jgi:class 3 adenylate cyclase|uniref:hypothetical protein n=1 Tax=uncultured Thiodictyon sp. TaxID=1846217 RepID=UPI0025CC2ACD|nr:hypothetical protein [uncultured Thiodictyon sp.]
MPWRPSPAEVLAPLVHPDPWAISLAAFGKGIDNAHIDCLLSPRFRIQAGETIRKLVREDAASLSRRIPEQLVGAEDLAALRDTYLRLFDCALERHPGRDPRDNALLLQFAVLKYLLQLVAAETQSLQETLKAQLQSDLAADAALSTDLHEQLVLVTRQAQGIQRRVGQLLFREVRKLESTRLQNARSAVLGTAWPVTDTLLFNPILLIPDPGEGLTLAADYPLGWLAGPAIGDWLAQTGRCLTQTFAPWLPGWMTGDGEGAEDAPPGQPPGHPKERRDQGQLRGFVATEILLERFVAREEYQQGLTSWLDEPANLRLLLDPETARHNWTGETQALIRSQTPTAPAPPPPPDWPRFRRELLEQLGAGLQDEGRRRAIEITYALPGLRTQLGQSFPLSLVLDYADGRLTRRRLEQRLAALRGGPDPLAVLQTLERLRALRLRQTPAEALALIGHYLVDFLTLRRDLKLAYKTFETLDAIRLLETDDEARLSRSNGSLHEFHCRGEGGPQTRRIRSHAVLKADVRGSTLITEELRARGLNPASHFSLNFFDPVNRLLPEFEAEKLFVEGDAVILALYEYVDDGPGLAVARACRLARKILQVVKMQNAQNHQLGLPDLELGIGISFSRREPNFLYDEGRRIMISSAINQADRLSSCSGLLLRSGFRPANGAFRVAVVRDAIGGERAGPGRDLLPYNVNGVKLDETAFLKLQEELPMGQLRLSDPGAQESLFFIGSYTDDDALMHWVLLRHAPVRDWDGDTVGAIEPDRRHYFELIVDEALATQARRLGVGGAGGKDAR